MKTQNLIIVFLLFAFLGARCDKDNLPPEKYSNWMVQNRALLTSKISPPGFSISLSYLPADWLAIREVGVDDIGQLEKSRKEYAGMEYYNLRIALLSDHGDILQFKAGNPEEYYQRVEYFSFGVQHDLHLLAGQDTQPCRLFHFERNYGAAPYIDFMVGFEEKPDNYFDRTLLYDERVFSDSLLTLTILNETIQRIPKLKL